MRVHGGSTGWEAFAAAAARLDPHAQLEAGGNGLQVAAASAQRGTHLAVIALLLFGALAALVTLLLAGQALARQVLLEEADLAVLASLGTNRAQIVALVTLRAALTGLAGGILAVAAAVAASPLMPVGLARQAEISPGISADPLVLTAGFLTIVMLTAAVAAPAAWRVSRRGPLCREATGRVGAPRLTGLLAHAPLPVATVLGVRFGLQRGRGPTAVPVATALAGAATAVTAVAAALTFAASLDALVRSPWQQGWNWDVLVGNPNTLTDPAGQVVPRLARNQLAGSYSAVTTLTGFSVNGAAVGNVLVFHRLKGAVWCWPRWPPSSVPSPSATPSPSSSAAAAVTSPSSRPSGSGAGRSPPP